MAALLVLVVVLQGCASNKVLSDSAYYQQGMQEMAEDSTKAAISKFESLLQYYPQSGYARQGYLELLHLYYLNSDYALLQSTAQTFLSLYSDDPRVDYAYYMRAAAQFMQSYNRFDAYITTNLNERDFINAESTYRLLSQFIQTYPHSAYAAQARAHLIYLRERLARLAFQQLKFINDNHNSPLSVLRRGESIFKHFADSPIVPETLDLLIQVAKQEGLTNLQNYYQDLQAKMKPHFTSLPRPSS